MPDPYRGLFLRHYLGEQPDGRRSSLAWTDSPDIIANGTRPAEDPTIFTTRASYDREQANTVQIRQLNYVYVRGLNTTAGKLDARLWLYYASSNAVIWPQDWRQGGIFVNNPDQPQNWVEITDLDPGAIGVSTPVFHWQADAPNAGAHFCMIAFAENPPLSNPPRSPKPVGSMGTWDELAEYVRSHPNMAWRNTIDVSSAGPTWTVTEPIEGARDGGEFNVGVKFKDMPTDGFFAFSVPGYDAGSTLVVPDPPDQKLRIPKSGTSIMLTLTWRRGFRSSISVSYWQGATRPPKGANIMPIIGVEEESLRGAPADGHRPAVELDLYESNRRGARFQAVRMQVVGSIPFQY